MSGEQFLLYHYSSGAHLFLNQIILVNFDRLCSNFILIDAGQLSLKMIIKFALPSNTHNVINIFFDHSN